MNEDDFKLLNLITDRLIDYAEDDMSAFNFSRKDCWEETDSGFRDEDGDPIWETRRCKFFNLEWDPTRNSWKSKEYSFKGRIHLKYHLFEKTVSIHIDHNRGLIVDIGGGSENPEYKKKMVNLFNKVKEWQAIEVPRKLREDFINDATKAFPDILDHMLLEEQNDKED